jgi:hypothetical protein
METKTAPSKTIIEADGGRCEIFEMEPVEENLFLLFKDIFGTYWDRVQFGPLIQGAAWEIAAPNAPTKISLLDGYLTVNFGSWHFHVCIGENKGTKAHPTPEKLKTHRKTARAEFYRRVDEAGIPNSWGFRCFNGMEEQQITVFLPNPNYELEPRFKKNTPPRWEKLDIWDTLRKKYLGLDPDEMDRKSEFKPCSAI